MNAGDTPGRGLPATRAGDFSVELYDGDSLSAAHWPSIAEPRRLRMYVYQSRKFLETWRATIGKARRTQPQLVVVRDAARRRVLCLAFAVETKFNLQLLRFMDAGVADYNAPILWSAS